MDGMDISSRIRQWFDTLADDPKSLDEHSAKLEHFVVICYKVSDQKTVNAERQLLFTNKEEM